MPSDQEVAPGPTERGRWDRGTFLACPVIRDEYQRRGRSPAGSGPDPARVRGHTSRLGRSVAKRRTDRKSTRLNSSHLVISYAVFCLKKKKKHDNISR